MYTKALRGPTRHAADRFAVLAAADAHVGLPTAKKG